MKKYVLLFTNQRKMADPSYVADPNFQRTTNKHHQKINKQTDKNIIIAT